jgi:hypothetical protein
MREQGIATQNLQQDVEPIELLSRVRMLFVAVIEQAIEDLEDLEWRDAYGFFWSDRFKKWCDICGWDYNRYEFLALRKRVKEIKGAEEIC